MDDRDLEVNMNKTFKIVNGDISDGFHTFDELYNHRIFLFIALCNQRVRTFKHHDCWKSFKHSDDSSYEGWFIAGIRKKPGHQITYHLPEKYWNCLISPKLDRAPEFDGHTSDDVLDRLDLLFFSNDLEVK